MKERNRKIVIILISSFFFVFSITSFILAADTDAPRLEVSYPGFEPTTAQDLLPNYVRYIYTFTIIGIGTLALYCLIAAGLRFLTSMGKPEKMRKARNDILAAFWGIVILLASYIILTTINPQLVILTPGELLEIPSTPSPPPVYTVATADLLERIKKLAERIKEIPPMIQVSARLLKERTDECDCKYTKPECICESYVGGKCEAVEGGCYLDSPRSISSHSGRRNFPSGPITFPPPSSEKLCGDETPEIRRKQQEIIELRYEILYYKTRVLAERNDLRLDIEKFLDKEISWYEEQIAADQTILDQLDLPGRKEREQLLIDYLEEEKGWLEEEKGYKEDLKEKLIELANEIDKITPPALTISGLPDECWFPGIKDTCEGTCIGGCHDIKGCHPAKCCGGGNPCPTDEIQNQLNEINPLPQKIIEICDQIISIIDNIVEVRTRQIQI